MQTKPMIEPMLWHPICPPLHLVAKTQYQLKISFGHSLGKYVLTSDATNILIKSSKKKIHLIKTMVETITFEIIESMTALFAPSKTPT
jgi:hypothetical protein